MSFRQISDRVQEESSNYNTFWMPVEDPVFSGDQVRHDDLKTFYEFINLEPYTLNPEPLTLNLRQEPTVPYFTTRDECKLFYRTYGIDTSNSVVIFLNGTTQTTMYWGSHIPAFSRHYRLLCYDARCQGQSDSGAAPITLQMHVSDLDQLLAYLAIDRCHLVGLSHGARVALEFAVEFPQMVEKLVLCSVSARTSDRCRTIVRSWLEILHLSD